MATEQREWELADRDKRVWLIEKAMREGRFLAGPPGKVAQWTKDEGPHLRPWQQSQINDAYDGRLQDPRIAEQEHRFSVPVLRKRTNQERLESMIRRLIDTPEPLQEKLLADISAGYWREGAPVTMADLRRVATDIMNKGDQRIKLSNRTGG